MRDVFSDRKHGQAVAGAKNLADEVRGGFFFEIDFLVRAGAGVDHKREIEGLLRFGLEDFELLFDAVLENLKGFARKIGRGAVVLVQDAGEDAYKIDADANFAALGRLIVGIAARRRYCRRRGGGGVGVGLRFARPRWAVSLRTNCAR